MSETEEEYLGAFLERANHWEVFLTDKRIFAIDYRNRMIRLAAETITASVAYITLFSLMISQVSMSIVLLPVLVLAGFFPFLFLIMRTASVKVAGQRKNAKKKFEIRTEDILRVEMQKPGILTGQGKLAIGLRSGWFITLLVVGRGPFRKVRGLMPQFCKKGSIQLVELSRVADRKTANSLSSE